MNNLSPHSYSQAPEYTANAQSSVLLLVQNAQDQELFKRFLPDYLTIASDLTNLESQEFDLCITDEHSVYQNRGWLREQKEKVAPIFLPVLLLSEDQETIRNNETLLEFADDVVYIPASSKLLKSRIQMLLRQREYSLRLEEKNRQLEQKNDQLVEEKQKFQLLADNSTDMISRHSPDGTYLYASPASEELIGYSPQELIGQDVFENMHPDDSERLRDKVKDFEDGKIERWEFRKQTKKGNYKWVESALRPIGDEKTGDIIEVQASTRDISDRKEFEQKLKEEKDFIDKAIQSLPELFYMIDEHQNFIKWNNIERVLGYSDEDMQNMHPADLFDEPDQESITDTIQEVFETGAGEAEVKIMAKSGELVPYYITARKFSRRNTDFIVGSGINLSKIKEVQRELEESKNRWEMLVKNDPDLIQILVDRKIAFINQAGANIYGAERPEEIIGKNPEDLIEIEDAEKSEQRLQQLQSGNIPDPTVHKIKAMDGKIRYVKTQSTPITYESNEKAIQVVGQDITDRFEYERELKQSLKEKETLLQEIHHRVKNNLAVVSGMLQLQAFNTENVALKKLLHDSESRIKTMALIHEKLYQSKSLSQIDFGLYVKELVENIMEVSLPRENIDVSLEFDSFSLNVNQAVPCALILNEIISNSFEHAFTDQKEGYVQIQLKETDQTIRVCIGDNGKGLPLDYNKKESMGFTIIDTLIKQLEADYNIDRDNGTAISFSFRKQQIKGSSSTLI